MGDFCFCRSPRDEDSVVGAEESGSAVRFLRLCRSGWWAQSGNAISCIPLTACRPRNAVPWIEIIEWILDYSSAYVSLVPHKFEPCHVCDSGCGLVSLVPTSSMGVGWRRHERGPVEKKNGEQLGVRSAVQVTMKTHWTRRRSQVGTSVKTRSGLSCKSYFQGGLDQVWTHR